VLRRVRDLLADRGIPDERIQEAYNMIKASGRYPARLPSHYLAIAIELIERDRERPGAVQIYISPKPMKYALGRPSVTFAVLALDWPGLIDSCTGTLHEKGFNIAFCEAVLIDEPDRKVGLIFMEIDVSDEGTFEHLLRLEPEISEALIVRAAEETGKRDLLIMATRKADQYSLIRKELRKIADPSEYPDLFGEKGEAVRFVLARTFAYLTERRPEDLAELIYTNYTFQKQVRETSRIYARVRNLDTPAGALTGISVAGYEHDLSMGDVFRVIDETVPGYQRKYDKAFITGDGINVFRIEIVDARGKALSPDQQVELERKLTAIEDVPVCDRLSPGVEIIGRKICPVMIEEERNLRVPQLYMHPHSRSNIKIVLVTSGADRGHAFDLIAEINKIDGLEAAMPDQPSLMTTGTGEATRVQEIAIIDVWVDFGKFFGTSKGPYRDELILTRIEEAIRNTKPIGAKIRIFDRMGRQLRQARAERICSMVSEKGHDPELARRILARLGDKQIISPTVPDNEIFEQVITGIEAIEKWRAESRIRPAIVWRSIEVGPAGRGASHTVLGIVHQPKKNYLPQIIRLANSFGLESSTVVDGDDFTLLMFRLSHQGRSLELAEIENLTKAIQPVLAVD